MQASAQNLPTPPVGVKYIPLTQGKYAIVDEEDYEWLSQWRWCYSEGYAVRGASLNGKKLHIRMHRLVNGTPEGRQTDHRNLNRLDNRRENLRLATHHQNLWNVPKRKTNKSGFKGVSWSRQNKGFIVQISFRGKTLWLGKYDTVEEAAGMYLTAALEYHRDFAHL